MLHFKQEAEKALFADCMKKMDALYDPARRMVWGYRGKNGYHSKLSDCQVHDIRGAFDYAYLLLCRDEEGDRRRAHDVLYRVIPLQDINPSNNTYGIWPYFLEEDLEEMDMPDWNWADFNGKTMLHCLMDHADKLSEDLRMRLQDSIHHACEAIIRRNVGPSYTNISVMGAYVTLLAGEMFGDLRLFTYGKERLRGLHAFNTAHDSFSEFNSPTYTFLCLGDLSLLARDIKDGDCKRMANELVDLAWDTIAMHYHVGTAQLAGPHDRAYAMLVGEGTRLTLERALDYRIELVNDRERLADQSLEAMLFTDCRSCPDKYIPCFTQPCGERVIDQTFAPGRMAYTYMCDAYTVGSLHHEVAWNQHRNVLGYLGTPKAPVCFNLKCLHDGWDYCSAVMSTVQDKGKTLTAFSFATDGGDTHIILDMIKDAAISAEDLRLRWQFEGAIDDLLAEQTGDAAFRVTHKNTGLTLHIAFPYTVFGENAVRYEITREQGKLGIDAVLYRGERRQICLNGLKAAAVTTLEVSCSSEPSCFACVREDAEGVEATFGNLFVRSAANTAGLEELKAFHRLQRDGKDYAPAY